MRFYELKSLKAFESASFFDIYEDAEAVLGADMLNWGEVELVPGDSDQVRVELHQDTRYVGFVAAYRSIEEASWRASKGIVPSQTNNVEIKLEKNALAL